LKSPNIFGKIIVFSLKYRNNAVGRPLLFRILEEMMGFSKLSRFFAVTLWAKIIKNQK